MKDIDQVAEDIFAIVKKNKAVPYNELYKIEDTNRVTVEAAWNLLISEYKLVRSRQQILSLSKDGKIHKSVYQYLKSLKPKKFTAYQKFLLILTSLFGFFGIGSWLYNTYSESNHKILEENYNSLKLQYDDVVLKYDSLEVKTKQLQEQILNDTLQNKN